MLFIFEIPKTHKHGANYFKSVSVYFYIVLVMMFTIVKYIKLKTYKLCNTQIYKKLNLKSYNFLILNSLVIE